MQIQRKLCKKACNVLLPVCLLNPEKECENTLKWSKYGQQWRQCYYLVCSSDIYSFFLPRSPSLFAALHLIAVIPSYSIYIVFQYF